MPEPGNSIVGQIAGCETRKGRRSHVSEAAQQRKLRPRGTPFVRRPDRMQPSPRLSRASTSSKPSRATTWMALRLGLARGPQIKTPGSRLDRASGDGPGDDGE